LGTEASLTHIRVFAVLQPLSSQYESRLVPVPSVTRRSRQSGRSRPSLIRVAVSRLNSTWYSVCADAGLFTLNFIR
jgi:hypothetical protein